MCTTPCLTLLFDVLLCKVQFTDWTLIVFRGIHISFPPQEDSFPFVFPYETNSILISFLLFSLCPHKLNRRPRRDQRGLVDDGDLAEAEGMTAAQAV